MSSAEQVAANQVNAKRSHGPKTTKGKSNSRMNSIKHGLPTDGPAKLEDLGPAYEAKLNSFLKSYPPRDERDRDLASIAAGSPN